MSPFFPEGEDAEGNGGNLPFAELFQGNKMPIIILLVDEYTHYLSHFLVTQDQLTFWQNQLEETIELAVI